MFSLKSTCLSSVGAVPRGSLVQAWGAGVGKPSSGAHKYEGRERRAFLCWQFAIIPSSSSIVKFCLFPSIFSSRLLNLSKVQINGQESPRRRRMNCQTPFSVCEATMRTRQLIPLVSYISCSVASCLLGVCLPQRSETKRDDGVESVESGTLSDISPPVVYPRPPSSPLQSDPAGL